MNTLKSVFIFAMCGTVLFLSSCKKEDKEKLTGTYNFTSISDDNVAYGFVRENGEAEVVPESEIDFSIFDECSQVHRVDHIEILTDETLSYTASPIWAGSGGEDRTEESSYTITDGKLEFAFRDEFGNEDPMIIVIDGDRLVLKVVGYVDVWNGNPLTVEVYDENPNFGYAPENASDRLSQDEGDEIYVLVYEQIYE